MHGRPFLQALILDTGALIALERRDRLVAGYIQRARDIGAEIVIPAGVVAQAWRNGSRQTRLAALLASRDITVDALDTPRARATGELCGRRPTSDIVDAAVVLAAHEHRGFALTSDQSDLLKLDPNLDLVAI